jgi:chemotaxis family two-component system sensor kinase Cph1
MGGESYPLRPAMRRAHFCGAYETPEQHVRLLAAFLKEGLARGELCICTTHDLTPAAMAEALESEGLDVSDAVAQGRLRIAAASDFLLTDGRLDADTLLGRLDRAVEEAVAGGLSGLRFSGEMHALASASATSDDVMALELRLAELPRSKPVALLCHYNVDLFDGATMTRAHNLHSQSFFWGKPPDGPFVLAPPSPERAG